MGRRPRTAAFMPGVYVFPGGRLERADRRPSGFPETLAELPQGVDRATRANAAAYARAALRETFEETGLLIGRPGSAGEPSPRQPWRAFAASGLTPAFPGLSLVARAITPPHARRRFHTRFFLADGAWATGEIGGDGELEDLHWVPVAQTDRLPLPPQITALVLREALAHRLDLARKSAPRRQAARFGWVGRRARHRLDPYPAEA